MMKLLRRLFSNKGGLSFGGGDGNSLRDVINTINAGGGVPSDPLNSVQFHNPQSSFDGSSNLRYIDGTGLLLGEDVKLYFNSNGGSDDCYVKFNASANYFELYVDGLIRAQF